jgi:hypothetical protein
MGKGAFLTVQPGRTFQLFPQWTVGAESIATLGRCFFPNALAIGVLVAGGCLDVDEPRISCR